MSAAIVRAPGIQFPGKRNFFRSAEAWGQRKRTGVAADALALLPPNETSPLTRNRDFACRRVGNNLSSERAGRRQLGSVWRRNFRPFTAMSAFAVFKGSAPLSGGASRKDRMPP